MASQHADASGQPTGIAMPVQLIGDIAVALLIEAGAVLATSLDQATTMKQVAQLTVPQLADLCVIDLLDDDGKINDVAVVAADDGLARRLEEMRRANPLDADGEHPVARVLRSGQAELLSEMSEQELLTFATDEDHARFMVSTGYRSAVVAPLTARDRTLGTISLLRFGAHAPYGEAESDLTKELARRAALAIDNARLFSHLRDLEQRLEAILIGLAEAVTVVDRQGRTIFANRAATELLGVKRVDELTGAMPGATIRRFLVFDEDGRELQLEHMPARRILRGEKPEPLLVRNVVRKTGQERWLIVRSSPISDPDSGETLYAVNVFEDITELKRAQTAERFLADASRVLSSSLDHSETLDQIAKLAVPQLASMCAVSLIDDTGEIAPVAVQHVDPQKLSLSGQLARHYPAYTGDLNGIAEVIRTKRSIHAQITPEDIAAHARDAKHLELLTQLQLRSIVIVPLTGGGQTLGAITLAAQEGDRPLTTADLKLAEELGRRAGTAVENARLFTERSRIASALQEALLPEALPTIEGLEIAARYTAAGELNEVGGDFYDVFEHRDGRWVLAIGDVCGKGPKAAAVTALARHTLRAAALSGQAPRVLLTSVHQALSGQPSGLDMCTLGVILVDLRPHEAHLTIVLAGHPFPLLIDADGDVRPIGRPGTMLGVIEPVHIEQTEVRMVSGETLLLHTDGVSEAGAPENPLGEEGLKEMCRLYASLPLPSLLARVEQAATDRAGGSARDDIALLAMRVATPDGGDQGGPAHRLRARTRRSDDGPLTSPAL